MIGRSVAGCAQVLGLMIEDRRPLLGFSIDSRSVKKGDLFFALTGAHFDGHKFLPDVAGRGAIAAVVSKSYTGPHFGLSLIMVDDVKEGLHKLAKWTMERRKERVVAITGSMGKTTTKEFLAILLGQRYRVYKTFGNQNTQLTVPLALLHLDQEYDFLILEMGMSRLGEIGKLVEIAEPDIAILTQIAPAGIEGFVGGLETVARAKCEIFSRAKTSLALVNLQTMEFGIVKTALAPITTLTYGWGNSASERDGGVVLDDSPMIPLFFEGRHLRENFLGAAKLARWLGLSWEEICKGARLLRPVERRFEKIEREGVIFFSDCYNANPESMKAALRNLPQPNEGGKRIAVLGGMVDLGESSKEFHREVGEVAASHIDRLFCLGEGVGELAEVFKAKGGEVDHLFSLREIKERLFAQMKPGDVVLIKGSNQYRLWEILDN